MPNVNPPDRLSLGPAAAKNWKIFSQRWNTYAVITDLSQINPGKQRALFLHCLDDDALEAFNSFNLADTAPVHEIITAFEKFIIGESNETYERFCFNKRVQEEGESFELFCADLHRLIKTCNYCTRCNESLLRDRIVLGVRDSEVQKELLKIRNLTLTKTGDICRASEQAKSQNLALQQVSQINRLEARRSNDNSKKPMPCKFCGSAHI